MKLSLIAPALPPRLDGIGDYSSLLARELAPAHDVNILTRFGDVADAIPGVAIRPLFDVNHPASFRAITQEIVSTNPDWLILQYNPFSYGRYGYNLTLPAVLRGLRRTAPRTRISVMVHEPFVPLTSWKFKVMATWQRLQLWQLGRAADVLFFSVDPWASHFRSWFPNKPVVHLPVGSNIPKIDITRGESRHRLNIAPDDLIVGVFGNLTGARMFDPARDALQAAARAFPRVRFLYLGKDVAAVRAIAGDIPTIADGALPAEEISRRLPAIDVQLAAFIDGISSRRGSVIAGLQHGVPIVGTTGYLTDPFLNAEDCHSFLLSPVGNTDAFVQHVLRALGDATLRAEMGRCGQDLYSRVFTWPAIAARMMSTLEQFSRESDSPAADRTAIANHPESRAC